MIFTLLEFCRSDGIFQKHYNENIVSIDVSGSSKQQINGSLQTTKPEYAILPFNKDYDWCSNCPRDYNNHPWIIFSLKHRKFRINGYFLRAGCCYYQGCCCDEDYYGCVNCCLFSWSLQISDDNKTWTDVHKVENDYEMKYCKEKTYKFSQQYTAKYVRLIQNENCPGWPPCIAINKLDLLGDVIADDGSVDEDFMSIHEDEDDVSIIGHISKNINP